MPVHQRILVTGVGGAPGFDLTRHLQSLGHDVIAADANPVACGLALTGVTPCLLPPAADPDFSTQLMQACRTHQPDALISTVERELLPLVALKDELAALGVRTWLPGRDAVTACGDKARFHTVLAAHGIPTPTTFLPHELDQAPLRSPLIVKPRGGQGSQNVIACETRAQASVLCELVPDPIIQERLTGKEFTADCLMDRTGRASVILRERLLVKAGLAVVSRTFHNAEATDVVRRTLRAVGAAGPCCVQGFITDGDGPRVVVTEVNARFAGAFPLSEAAGAHLVAQTLNGLFDAPVDHTQLAYKPDVYLIKGFETVATGTWPPLAHLGALRDNDTAEGTR